MEVYPEAFVPLMTSKRIMLKKILTNLVFATMLNRVECAKIHLIWANITYFKNNNQIYNGFNEIWQRYFWGISDVLFQYHCCGVHITNIRDLNPKSEETYI